MNPTEKILELSKQEELQAEQLRQTKLQLAQLFEDQANKRFADKDPGYWIEVWAAITTWTEVHMFEKAKALCNQWMPLVAELDSLLRWVDQRRVLDRPE